MSGSSCFGVMEPWLRLMMSINFCFVPRRRYGMFVSCFKTMYDVKMYEVNHFNIVFSISKTYPKFWDAFSHNFSSTVLKGIKIIHLASARMAKTSCNIQWKKMDREMQCSFRVIDNESWETRFESSDSVTFLKLFFFGKHRLSDLFFAILGVTLVLAAGSRNSFTLAIGRQILARISNS